MNLFSQWRVTALAAVLLVGTANTTDAQVNPRDLPIVAQPQQRFDSGQDIQPIFEGWSRNDDGSYLFHFGYLNRNYREQPHIPVGPANYFSPGEQDRGQPTHFYPRTQRYQFTVHVPASMGPSLDDGLVWTGHASRERAASIWLAAAGVGDRREHDHVEQRHRSRAFKRGHLRRRAAIGHGRSQRIVGRGWATADVDGDDHRRRAPGPAPTSQTT